MGWKVTLCPHFIPQERIKVNLAITVEAFSLQQEGLSLDIKKSFALVDVWDTKTRMWALLWQSLLGNLKKRESIYKENCGGGSVGLFVTLEMEIIFLPRATWVFKTPFAGYTQLPTEKSACYTYIEFLILSTVAFLGHTKWFHNPDAPHPCLNRVHWQDPKTRRRWASRRAGVPKWTGHVGLGQRAGFQQTGPSGMYPTLNNK